MSTITIATFQTQFFRTIYHYFGHLRKCGLENIIQQSVECPDIVIQQSVECPDIVIQQSVGCPAVIPYNKHILSHNKVWGVLL